MTFRERYLQEKSWYAKTIIMEIYHLTMTQKIKSWTVYKTAEYFSCSVGLVSENLAIARYSHNHPTILNCDTRQSALDKMR